MGGEKLLKVAIFNSSQATHKSVWDGQFLLRFIHESVTN